MTVREYADYLLSCVEDLDKHYSSEAIAWNVEYTQLSSYHHPLICHIKVMEVEETQPDMFQESRHINTHASIDNNNKTRITNG